MGRTGLPLSSSTRSTLFASSTARATKSPNRFFRAMVRHERMTRRRSSDARFPSSVAHFSLSSSGSRTNSIFSNITVRWTTLRSLLSMRESKVVRYAIAVERTIESSLKATSTCGTNWRIKNKYLSFGLMLPTGTICNASSSSAFTHTWVSGSDFAIRFLPRDFGLPFCSTLILRLETSTFRFFSPATNDPYVALRFFGKGGSSRSYCGGVRKAEESLFCDQLNVFFSDFTRFSAGFASSATFTSTAFTSSSVSMSSPASPTSSSPCRASAWLSAGSMVVPRSSVAPHWICSLLPSMDGAFFNVRGSAGRSTWASTTLPCFSGTSTRARACSDPSLRTSPTTGSVTFSVHARAAALPDFRLAFIFGGPCLAFSPPALPAMASAEPDPEVFTGAFFDRPAGRDTPFFAKYCAMPTPRPAWGAVVQDVPFSWTSGCGGGLFTATVAPVTGFTPTSVTFFLGDTLSRDFIFCGTTLRCLGP